MLASAHHCNDREDDLDSSAPRVKICCIQDEGEADLAIAAGAHAVGLVSAMPSGPGVISEETITRIARHVSPPAETFLLTSLRDADAIVDQHSRCATDTIQLCDRLKEGAIEALRARLPGIRLIQVVHMAGDESLQETRSYEGRVDGLLLDSGNPELAEKELGGTGRTHDWSMSRRICEAVTLPVYLAGGLKTENIQEAIRAVRPFGVDLCSGVRSDGRLDSEKLSAFMGEIKEVRDHGSGE